MSIYTHVKAALIEAGVVEQNQQGEMVTKSDIPVETVARVAAKAASQQLSEALTTISHEKRKR